MAKKSARRLAGEGGIYQRGDGMWEATIERGIKPNGKRDRHVMRSKSKDRVLEKFREAKAELLETGTVGAKKITVVAWLNQWLEEIVSTKNRPKTRVDYERVVRLHLTPVLGKTTLANLSPGHVRRMMEHIAKEKTPAAAVGAHSVLSIALSAAQADGLVARNAAKLATAPTSGTPEIREALTGEDAKKLIATSRFDPMGARWAFALWTGTRQGEALGLEWDRVDLRTGQADISWQLQRLPYKHGCPQTPVGPGCKMKRGGNCPNRILDCPRDFEWRQINKDTGLVLTRPKTSKGQRMVPLPPPLLAEIKRLRKAHGELAKGLVWATAEGMPIDPKDDAKAWHRALLTAGIRDVPLHSARHTTATLLLEAGVDSRVIMDLLGHTKVATTQGYQHVDAALAMEAMQRLTDVLS